MNAEAFVMAVVVFALGWLAISQYRVIRKLKSVAQTQVTLSEFTCAIADDSERLFSELDHMHQSVLNTRHNLNVVIEDLTEIVDWKYCADVDIDGLNDCIEQVNIKMECITSEIDYLATQQGE